MSDYSVPSLIGLVIAALIAFWVASDAKKRGMNGIGWGIGVFLICIIFLPIYLIVRKPLLAQPDGYPPPPIAPPQYVPPPQAYVPPQNVAPPPNPTGPDVGPHSFCANCGNKLPPNAKFCSGCGHTA